MDSEDNSQDSASSSSTSRDMHCDSVAENISPKETVMEKSNAIKVNGTIPSVRDIETQNKGADSDDEFDAFGKSIIAQMRKLPEEYAVVLMSEIQTLLTRKRLKYIVDRRNPNVPQNPLHKTFPL